ncbi:MAG TPA: amidohydrolase family protein [Dongiaceae bacterium]|nr:amidohydrolase family protein [Dongiaceae bacterium]
MIIDSLTHITPTGQWFDTSFDAGEQQLLRQLDDSSVERAVMVALAGHIENRFVREVCERHPSRLIPCASFNPAAHTTPSEVRSRVRDELQGQPYRALKLHPRLNRYDPLDARCLAVLEEVAMFDRPLPIWMDTLFYYHGGTLSKPVVDTIHELVGKFPSLTFVLLHGGGTWIAHVAEAVRDCPNAFLDISFTLHRYRDLLDREIRHLVSTFDRRVIFGSDFPEISIRDALQSFHEVTTGLPAEKCANVLGANLGRILRLHSTT